MTEELRQTVPVQLSRFVYYRLGATNLATLAQQRIISEDVAPEVVLNRPDGLIVDPTGHRTKAYIEHKTPETLRTPRQIEIAIRQELIPARSLCKLLVVTDGKKSLWINTLTGNYITDERGDLPVFSVNRIMGGGLTPEESVDLESLLDLIEASLSETNDTVIRTPIPIDPSPLARTIWQKIWVQTTRAPEQYLYNVVELFVFKFLSDLGALEDDFSFTRVYQMHNRNTERSDERALDYYAKNCRPEIHKLFPSGSDGTTIINGTIFVNEEGNANLAQAHLFGQVLDDLQNYSEQYGSFRHIHREFKTRLYESFLRQSAGVRFLGQHFTPPNVVRAMLDMSPAGQLSTAARICDPFCGVGGFILETIANVPRISREFEPQNGQVAPNISLTGYDKGTDEKEDARTIILAKANMLIYFSDLLARYNTSQHLKAFAEGAFNQVFSLIRTNLGTFGRVNDEPYDLILTNPPYVTSGSRSLKRTIEAAGLSQHYSAGGRGTESLALEWVIRNLKPGGTAIKIVPDGLLRQRPMLSYVKRECVVRGIVSLPSRTFYSTSKKTYILALERKLQVTDRQSDPVFTFVVNEIGETRDSRRWPLEHNDLVEAVALYNQFKGGPTYFAPNHLRCKTITFSDFEELTHWMVDRYWSESERKQLGITDEQPTTSTEELLEFTRGLRETLDTMGNFPPEDFVHTQYREVSLGDKSHFSLSIGKRITKRNMDAQGVPVYSAGNVERPFGYLSNPGNRARKGPALLWSIDGNFEWGFVPENQEFIPTDHCGILTVTNEAILPKYLYYELQETKGVYGSIVHSWQIWRASKN